MKNQISSETWASIINDHIIEKKSVKKICEERSMIYSTVYYGLKRYHINPDSSLTDLRKFKVDDEYFKNIDCENKAYLLGFIITDGTISTKRNRIVLKLKESDIDILKFMNKEIAGDYKLSKDSNTIRNKTFYSYRLEIKSKALVDQLISLGIVTNKTSKEYLPILSDELMPHLIRGIFDGDGSIGTRKEFIGKKKMVNVNICSTSKSFLDSIKQYCGGNIYLEKRPGMDMYRLIFTSAEMKLSFYNYIYTNSSIFLNRKKLIFDNYVNTVLK